MDVEVRRTIDTQAVELLSVVSCNGTIAGSYPLWLYDVDADWQPSDIDIFTYTQADYDIVKGKLKDVGYKQTFETRHATSWTRNEGEYKVQLIKPVFNVWSTDDVLNRFDISVACFALIDATTLLTTDIAIHDVEKRVCRIVHDHNDPIVHIRRLMKYEKKGYHVFLSDILAVMEMYRKGDYSELTDRYLKYSKIKDVEGYA